MINLAPDPPEVRAANKAARLAEIAAADAAGDVSRWTLAMRRHCVLDYPPGGWPEGGPVFVTRPMYDAILADIAAGSPGVGTNAAVIDGRLIFRLRPVEVAGG